MIPGFKKRLHEEIIARIENEKKYKELLGNLVDEINFVDVSFKPNILSMIGGSLLAGLNSEVERFMITAEQFKENDNKLPDRFGDCFFKPKRPEVLEKDMDQMIPSRKSYYGASEENKFSETVENSSEDDKFRIPKTDRFHNYFNLDFEVAIKSYK